jgi:hypothetical protein
MNTRYSKLLLAFLLLILFVPQVGFPVATSLVEKWPT